MKFVDTDGSLLKKKYVYNKVIKTSKIYYGKSSRHTYSKYYDNNIII